jgi:glyoxylase-like metal-dependent hydrolase (beta-lactamase superfamily II)
MKTFPYLRVLRSSGRVIAPLLSSLVLTTATLGADAPAPAPAAGRGRGGIDWNSKAAPWGALKNAPMTEQDKSPFKIFDNVYYVGLKTVAAYIITTSDGLVLLDAAYSQTTDQILGNIRALNFDPKNIRYIIISHSHGDHYAGAGAIAAIGGAHVVMSEKDWDAVETQQASGLPTNGLKLKRDVAVKDGETLKVGDTTFTFYVTPGHTAGALSTVYQVRDGAKSYRAVSPGGLGFNFGPAQTATYLASITRLKQLGPWDTILANHAYMGPRDLFEVEKDLKTRGSGPHPAVFGAAKSDAWFDQIISAASQKQTYEQQQPAAAPAAPAAPAPAGK